jgi:hypothetical protein
MSSSQAGGLITRGPEPATKENNVPDVNQHHAAEGDEERWREAAQLRRDHPGWVIVWLAPSRQFKAYPLYQGQRAEPLIAGTAAELAELISRAPPR